MTDNYRAYNFAPSLPIIPGPPTSATSAETEHRNLPSLELPDQDDEMVGPALYPPVLLNMEVLGYITDKNGLYYPRNMGRSVSIHDEMYYMFGNTVCEDAAGNYIGITSNTIAYVDDRTKFLESEYKEISANGMVKDFVPLNEAEISIENNIPGARVVFSMFGGAVDIGAVGVVLFHASIVLANGLVDYVGVYQALITTYADGRLIVDRHPWLVFGPYEPKIGSFSSLFYKNYVYLWSHRSDGQIILARVPDLCTADRGQYRYWSGGAWIPSWQDAQPILHDIQHGAIVHTELFGKDKPFVLVGVNQRGDNIVRIGAAANVQGPFDLNPVCKAISMDNDDSIPIHCIYPHLFASDISKRELIVTWSELSPNGGVIAAKLKFKIDYFAALMEAEERRRAAEEEEERRRSVRMQETYRAYMAEHEEMLEIFEMRYYNAVREASGSTLSSRSQPPFPPF